MEDRADDAPRIYIVDDDPNFLVALRRLLSSEGYDVAAFGSPASFLEAHDPARPGCLLLDLKMAEMDGLDVQSRLVADGEMRPIIFITGEASIPSTVMAIKRGARDYLTKPVDPEVLLAAVRGAIADDARRRAARAAGGPVESWETAVTERGDIALSFVASGAEAPGGDGGRKVLGREAAMGIARDILRAVAHSDAEDDEPAQQHPELSVFAIRRPDAIF